MYIRDLDYLQPVEMCGDFWRSYCYILSSNIICLKEPINSNYEREKNTYREKLLGGEGDCGKIPLQYKSTEIHNQAIDIAYQRSGKEKKQDAHPYVSDMREKPGCGLKAQPLKLMDYDRGKDHDPHEDRKGDGCGNTKGKGDSSLQEPIEMQS